MFKKGSLSIWIMLLALAAVTFSCNKHGDDWGEETEILKWCSDQELDN